MTAPVTTPDPTPLAPGAPRTGRAPGRATAPDLRGRRVPSERTGRGLAAAGVIAVLLLVFGIGLSLAFTAVLDEQLDDGGTTRLEQLRELSEASG